MHVVFTEDKFLFGNNVACLFFPILIHGHAMLHGSILYVDIVEMQGHINFNVFFFFNISLTTAHYSTSSVDSEKLKKH